MPRRSSLYNLLSCGPFMSNQCYAVVSFVAVVDHSPDAKWGEWTSAAAARICFASKSHTNSAPASQTPDKCGSCAESTRTLARNWIRPHSPGWVAKGWTLRFGPVARTTDGSWGSWWRQCRWCRVSSTWRPGQMCRGRGTQEPIKKANII